MMEEIRRKKKSVSKEGKKIEEKVETRGKEEDEQVKKRKLKDIDDVENEEVGYKENKKKSKKNVQELGNNTENISVDGEEIEDKVKKKKKRKKDGRVSGNLTDKIIVQNQEIENKKKKKNVQKLGNNMVNVNDENQLEIEDDEPKKKKKKKKENGIIEDQETENMTKKKDRKKNNSETKTGIKKTKKQKSRKSKSQEESILHFVSNDENEGLKNISVDENGDLGDDITENQVADEATVKKKNKEKRKKDEMKIAETGITDESDKKSSGDEALLYLKMWKDDRPNWTFKKVRQVWLLKNMFDKSRIPDNDFEVLLLYLEGLQGMARKTTISRAEALLESGDDDQKLEVFDMERVTKLLQMLN